MRFLSIDTTPIFYGLASVCSDIHNHGRVLGSKLNDLPDYEREKRNAVAFGELPQKVQDDFLKQSGQAISKPYDCKSFFKRRIKPAQACPDCALSIDRAIYHIGRKVGREQLKRCFICKDAIGRVYIYRR